MTQASDYLYQLASKITEPYLQLPTIRAAMLTGSAAKQLSDDYSDIDMTYYYEEALPSEETLTQIREQNGGSPRKWVLGDRETGSFAEAYHVNGIEVQIGHTTIASWEASIKDMLENLDVESPRQKAMEGTLASVALYGKPLMDKWKAQIAAYPDALAEAMVKHNLRFFPVWGLIPHFTTRDATLWYYEILVESAQRIVGILAGLNKLYFTTFQFKRTGRFIGQMAIKPDNLYERLESVFESELETAVITLEQLVAETITLVESHMPQIDTTAAKARIGWRQQPWQPVN